jgi:DnaJ-class molecular chaperone
LSQAVLGNQNGFNSFFSDELNRPRIEQQLEKKLKLENDNFQKHGNHLIYTKTFTLEEIQQDSFDIPHPNGKINVKFPKTTDTSKPMRVKDKGFKIEGQQGDLLINQFLKFTRN